MSTTKISHRVEDFAGRPNLIVQFANRVPSWLRFGEGWARLDLTVYATGLAIDACESGPKSNKRVMLQMDEASTRKLYELLHKQFGDTTNTGSKE